MQLTLLSVATALAATASARSAISLNSGCDKAAPHARIVNRCDYPVHIWSVLKGNGCPAEEMVTLKTGESYYENYAKAVDPSDPEKKSDGRGVSIKISKTEQCKGNDITQLEYFLDNRPETEKMYQLNYLDVSYVDCLSDCPTKQEGYYLQAGDSTIRATKKTTDNSWCPILACSNAAECAKMSYILPDDIQTKTCDFDSSMTFYMCGSQAPGANDDKPAPKPESSKKVDTPAPKPTPSAKAPSSPANEYKVNAAAVTPVAEIKDKAPKVKTKVVYVTAYEYVNAKRSEHVHAHARRHQAFHA